MNGQYLYDHINPFPNWAKDPDLLQGCLRDDIIQVLRDIKTGVPPEHWLESSGQLMMTNLQRVEYILGATDREIWLLDEDETLADFNEAFYDIFVPGFAQACAYKMDDQLSSLDTIVAMTRSGRGGIPMEMILKDFTLARVNHLMMVSANLATARRRMELRRSLAEALTRDREEREARRTIVKRAWDMFRGVRGSWFAC
jgi:hypothetical protein